jgi:hypothetical protein
VPPTLLSAIGLLTAADDVVDDVLKGGQPGASRPRFIDYGPEGTTFLKFLCETCGRFVELVRSGQ